MNDVMDRAIRRRRGQAIRQEYLLYLSKTLGVIVHQNQLLSLDHTDRLKERVSGLFSRHEGRDQTKFLFQQDWQGTDPAPVRETLRRVLENSHDEIVVLLPENSTYCGGLETPFHYILSRALRLISAGQDTITVASRDGNSGILLRYHRSGKERPSSEFILTVWGEDWVEAVSPPQAV